VHRERIRFIGFGCRGGQLDQVGLMCRMGLRGEGEGEMGLRRCWVRRPARLPGEGRERE